MKGTHLSIILPVVALLLRCVNLAGPGGEGNGSETTARGVIVDSTGAPAAGVPVQLLPAAYDPVAHDTLPAEWRVLTDNRGEYRLGGIAAGTYALEASSISTGLKVLVKDIEITGRRIELAVDTGRLEETGTVFVQLAGLTRRSGDYVYLPGTSTFAMITDRDSVAGRVVLNGVPAGTFSDLIYVGVGNSRDTDLLRDVITVHPGDTVASAYAAWKYARQIFLNTTVSGADIPANVYDFPVLVRLSGATFDFSRAQSKGEDIRFAKSDGSPLAHEIEQWDGGERKAEIWVKVDTVYGNSSSRRIAMYWGNPDAVDSSNSVAVFDTAAGFKGVWHLGDNGGIVLDATINGYNGTRNGNQARIAGDIGYGQCFDGSGGYTDMGDVCDLDMSSLTVCAWIKKSVSGKIQTIVSKSMGGSPSSSYGWLLELDKDGALAIFTATGTGAWGDTRTFVLASNIWITDSSWHHVAAVIDRSGGNNSRLYIDGSDVSTLPTAGDITKVGRVVNSSPLRLGSDANGGFPWNGSLDECTVSFRTRPPDWVRLSYMNQRRDERLILLK
jgi:hypothetical protein